MMMRVLTRTISIGFTQRSRRWRASGPGHPLQNGEFLLEVRGEWGGLGCDSLPATTPLELDPEKVVRKARR
jgi:hypothetical protein